jgi:hypothetical protein
MNDKEKKKTKKDNERQKKILFLCFLVFGIGCFLWLSF